METNNNKSESPAYDHARITGFAHDILNIAGLIEVLESFMDKPLNNANRQIVAIGLVAEGGNVHTPCLFINHETEEWGWARDLYLIDDGKAVVWSNGHYVGDHEYALASFMEACDGQVIWHTRAF